MTNLHDRLNAPIQRMYNQMGKDLRVYNANPPADATDLPEWVDEGLVKGQIVRAQAPEDTVVAGGADIEQDALVRIIPDSGFDIHAAIDNQPATVFRHEPDGATATETHEWFQAFGVHRNATGVVVVDVKRSDPLNV